MTGCTDSVGRDIFQRTVAMLGGAKAIRCRLSDPYEAHDLFLAGLPVGAALHLIRSLGVLGNDPSLLPVLGVSGRTLRRWQEARVSRRLSRAQSEQFWVLAETLILAAGVLGSQCDAEKWLGSPIPSLNGRRPIDLLATSFGAKLVTDHILRIEHGVYT